MSFILDALRKSESERQRDRIPNLARIPMAAPRRVTPAWVWILVSLLVLAVVMLAGAWWRSRDAAPVVSVRSAPTAAIEIPLPRLEESVPDRTPPPEEPEPDQIRGEAEIANPGTANDQEGAGEQATSPSTPAPAPVATRLSTVADLMAAGITVPNLVLELNVFHADPSQRFVFINGGRYEEGQRLTDGPRVVEIRREGAVLSFEGRNFLLLPQQ